MSEDYGPPLPLRKGKGGALKIKRGGTGKVSNSGNAAGRFHAPVRALRDPKTGKHLPQPPRGKPIWDPDHDPFIVEYRKLHPPTTPREDRGSAQIWSIDIETGERKLIVGMCEYPDCDEAHCCGKPPEVVSIKKGARC